MENETLQEKLDDLSLYDLIQVKNLPDGHMLENGNWYDLDEICDEEIWLVVDESGDRVMVTIENVEDAINYY